MVFPQLSFGVEIGTAEEPPGNFARRNGTPTGLSVDFVKEIQKRIGDKSIIRILPGARLIQYSLTKKNYVIFSLSRTKAREDKYHWISLVMRKPLAMFSKKDFNLNIRNFEDAKKVKRIGVLRGSVQHEYLLENNFNNIVPIANHAQNFKKLIAGRIDLMYHSTQGMAQLCKDSGISLDEFKQILILQISNSSIAMSKNSDIQIVKKWQNAAKEIKADGTFDKLAMKWLKYTEKVIGVKSEIKDGALNFWRAK